MSTTPETTKDSRFAKAQAQAPSTQFQRRPGLILLKGLVSASLIIAALVALGMNYELVWDVLVGTILPGLKSVFELAESALDSFFVLVGLGGFANIATAYTGFVVLLAVSYLLARKGMKAYYKTQTKKKELGQVYAEAWDEWFGMVKAKATKAWGGWWNSLDLTNKVVAVVFMVLIGIPLALLVSFILGSLVANLF